MPVKLTVSSPSPKTARRNGEAPVIGQVTVWPATLQLPSTAAGGTTESVTLTSPPDTCTVTTLLTNPGNSIAVTSPEEPS